MSKNKPVPVKAGRVVFSTREEIHIDESIKIVDEHGNTVASARLEVLSKKTSFTTFIRKYEER